MATVQKVTARGNGSVDVAEKATAFDPSTVDLTPELAESDFGAWVAGVADLFDAAGSPAGHIVAYHLRDLAAEARFLGLGDPISPAEYVNRRDTQLGWLQQR